MRITKIEAAVRQLDASIHLVFSGGDPVAAHSLAAAAANILSDLVETRANSSSWRSRIASDHGLDERGIRSALNGAWNFFKHADRDPNGILEFRASDTEAILFYASLECSELGVALSTPVQVFQLWLIASKRFDFGVPDELQHGAELLFPGLVAESSSRQLARGLAALQAEAAHAQLCVQADR